MKTEKQVNQEFQHLRENYKKIKTNIAFQPTRSEVMVKHPKTDVLITKEEYQESLKPKVI